MHDVEIPIAESFPSRSMSWTSILRNAMNLISTFDSLELFIDENVAVHSSHGRVPDYDSISCGGLAQPSMICLSIAETMKNHT